MVYTDVRMGFSPLIVAFFLISILSCRSDSSSVNGIISYQEEHRNQYHFSPQENWMNDPNGLVFYDGEYHLFYQYYPDSNVWGPMHWGHAVSEDLTHWEHLPIALYPDSLGDIFSGSAVIDWDNTSGLSDDIDRPPMIAFFTHHLMEGEKSGAIDFQYQSLAYSLDKGRTWTKYHDNPVIDNPGIKDFRDPKVIWDGEQWVMVFAAYDKIKFYTSDNLIDWKFSSDFGQGFGAQGRPWECPDLFPLVADDGEKKWVLIVSIGREALNGGSGTQYFVGEWDGQKFSSDLEPSEIQWLDQGKDNYAGVTWSDVPESDGRRLFIGWMSNWQYAQVVPTTVWRSAMTIPRELSLKKKNEKYVVIQRPVEELKQLRQQTAPLHQGIVKEPTNLLGQLDDKNGLYEVELIIERPDSFPVSIDFKNDKGATLSVGYDPSHKKYFVDRTFAGKSDFSNDFAGLHQSTFQGSDAPTLTFHLFIDKASIEVFLEDGELVMTEVFFPKDDLDQLVLMPGQNEVKVLNGRIYALKSIW